MGLPKRETARLRFGRFSVAGARYFITICTKNREPILTQPDIGQKPTEIIQSMHDSGKIELIASTVMPDHVHLLLTLGRRLRVGQVIGKFKTLSRDKGRVSWRWLDDGFEHQLRDVESIEDYGFYICMNPYRAGLCALTQTWPWWICPDPRQLSFLEKLGSTHSVSSAWLGLSEEVAARITVRG